MIGELGILNVSAGDTKLTFDPRKPEEVKRAAAVVEDMLRRGFAILVQVGENEKGPLYQRATGFDPETAEYIIAGAPSAELEEVSGEEPERTAHQGRKRTGAGGRIKQPARAKAATKRVPATRAKAVAVSRTAGG